MTPQHARSTLYVRLAPDLHTALVELAGQRGHTVNQEAIAAIQAHVNRGKARRPALVPIVEMDGDSSSPDGPDE